MSILVLGSGQLARMMALAGYPLGISVQAVDVADNKIVDPLSKQIINNSLDRMIEEVNAITVEFEHIPEELLQTVHASGKLMPSVEAILAGADRVREKSLLEKLEIKITNKQIIIYCDFVSCFFLIPVGLKTLRSASVRLLFCNDQTTFLSSTLILFIL